MRRNTATMLVIIAALFAVDIALRVSPQEATGFQEPEIRIFPEPSPKLVAMTAFPQSGGNAQNMHRLWSDGVVEWRRSLGPAFWDPATPEWQELVPYQP